MPNSSFIIVIEVCAHFFERQHLITTDALAKCSGINIDFAYDDAVEEFKEKTKEQVIAELVAQRVSNNIAATRSLILRVFRKSVLLPEMNLRTTSLLLLMKAVKLLQKKIAGIFTRTLGKIQIPMMLPKRKRHILLHWLV